MENVIDTIAGWPMWVSVLIGAVYFAGAIRHIAKYDGEWACGFGLIWPLWLLSWPARRLLRWRRNRRNLRRLTLGGWADIFKMTMPCMPRQNFVFTDANGGGKWVDAAKQPFIIDKGDGLVHYQLRFDDAPEPAHSIDEAMKRLKPAPYGGSKPSEDARPVTRKEFEAKCQEARDAFISVRSRLAALEAKREPKCTLCGDSGAVVELPDTGPPRKAPCPGCQMRYTIHYY